MRCATCLVLVALLLGSTAAPSGAQVDLSKVLVGKWDGSVTVPPRGGSRLQSPFRTLLIKSAQEQDGKWSVRAEYGITGQRMAPVSVEVSVAGNDVTLRFQPAAAAGGQAGVIELKLEKENYLAGSQRFTNFPEAAIHLEKAK